MHLSAEHFHAEHFRAGYWQRAIAEFSRTDGPRGHRWHANDADAISDWWALYGKVAAQQMRLAAIPAERFDRWPPMLLTPEEERQIAEQKTRIASIEAQLAELERKMPQ